VAEAGAGKIRLGASLKKLRIDIFCRLAGSARLANLAQGPLQRLIGVAMRCKKPLTGTRII
jgi:hypothetical protein